MIAHVYLMQLTPVIQELGMYINMCNKEQVNSIVLLFTVVYTVLRKYSLHTNHFEMNLLLLVECLFYWYIITNQSKDEIRLAHVNIFFSFYSKI